MLQNNKSKFYTIAYDEKKCNVAFLMLQQNGTKTEVKAL